MQNGELRIARRACPYCGCRGSSLQRCGCGDAGCCAPYVTVILSDFTGAERVYIASGYTDLRLVVDGLIAQVNRQFTLFPFETCLFLFCGRKRDRIKALYWTRYGFLLLYKRLESGSFQWPQKESGAKALTMQQYRWLMEELSIDQSKTHKQIGGFEII